MLPSLAERHPTTTDHTPMTDEDQSMTREALLAEICAGPQITAFAAAAFAPEGIGPLCLSAEIKKACDEFSNGELTRVERVLMAQFLALNASFTALMQRAASGDTECFLKLAFRVQTACVRTALALGQLKNPAVQVNNENARN